MADKTTAAPGMMRRARELVIRHWISLLVAFHAAKMAFWFSAVEFGSALPLANVDYIQFYGRVLRMHEFLQRSGRIWGYDPFDMGGYLSGPFLEVGTHLLALVSHVLEPVMPIATTMLLVEIIGLAAAPFLMVVAARLLGATRDQAWMAFGIGAFLVGSVEPFSTGMYKLGLWGWMVSSYLSLVQVALFWRWLEAPTTRRWLPFTAVSAILFQVHPSALVIVAAPCIVAYAMTFRRLGARAHLSLAGTAVAVLAANWYWISPFLAFSGWRATAPYYDTEGFLDLAQRFGPFQKDFYTSVRALIHAALAYLALRGLDRLRRSDPRMAILLGSWMLWLAVVSFFGSSFPWLRTLQPGRNEFPLWLVVYLPAGLSISAEVWDRRRARRLTLLLMGFAAVYVFELAPGASPWSKFAPPLKAELAPWQADLIRQIPREKTGGRRILLECNDDLQPHFADIIPHLTGAVLIGGQHPGNFLRARSTVFSGIYVVHQERRSDEPLAFGHKLAEMDERRFAEYLRLYNVGLVIARMPGTVEALSRFTRTLEPAALLAPHRIFRVRQPSTWFAEGSGNVTLDYDRIVIDNASAGRLVVKSHWLSTFRVSPEMPISPVYLMDDPVPFIEIDNAAGHDRIEIYNAGLPPVLDRLAGKFTDHWGTP